MSGGIYDRWTWDDSGGSMEEEIDGPREDSGIEEKGIGNTWSRPRVGLTNQEERLLLKKKWH